jgi:hypothetical protein
MKVKKTEAYKAQWANHILPLFADWEVLEDKSDLSFRCSGKVDLLVKCVEAERYPWDKNEYAHIRWDYGSCIGCDSFYEMTHLGIMKDLLGSVLYFEDDEELEEWKKRRSETNGEGDEEDC